MPSPLGSLFFRTVVAGSDIREQRPIALLASVRRCRSPSDDGADPWGNVPFLSHFALRKT